MIVGGVFVLEALSVIIQVAFVQAHGAARLPDGAAPPPFRTHWLERAESDHAVRDPRDHLRALQPHHPQAAMTTSTFSVAGKRVVVVGAARSGVAAAELLVRRGAQVTLTDTREAHRRRGAPPRGGRPAGVRPPRAETLTSADLIVLSPGVPPRQAAIEQRAPGGRRGHGRAGARLAMAARPRRGDHRHEGQIDDDDADGPDARSRRSSGARRRQHRHRAERAGRRLHRRHDPRRRGEQLSARDHGHVQPVDCGADELLARSSGSSRRRGGVRRRQVADLRQSRRRTTGPC